MVVGSTTKKKKKKFLILVAHLLISIDRLMQGTANTAEHASQTPLSFTSYCLYLLTETLSLKNGSLLHACHLSRLPLFRKVKMEVLAGLN